MATEPQIVIVTAFIKPQMEDRVVRALHELPEFPGFSITEVRGQGRGRGIDGEYQPSEYGLTLNRHLQVQLACPAELAPHVCKVIAESAWTGQQNDGVIFTTKAQDFTRISESGRADNA